MMQEIICPHPPTPPPPHHTVTTQQWCANDVHLESDANVNSDGDRNVTCTVTSVHSNSDMTAIMACDSSDSNRQALTAMCTLAAAH